MRSRTLNTEAEILADIINPEKGELSRAAAESVLDLRFSRGTEARIRTLLRANNAGRISDQERTELERFLRVGQLIDLLQAKARASLDEAKAA
jgi:hypothetical protein